MKRGAITCSGETSIREVAQIMVLNRIRYCVVLNEKNEIAGIISAHSILKAFGKDLDTMRAADILYPHTYTISPENTLEEAVKVMRDMKIEHIVVVSDKQGSKLVLGILNAGDIVTKIAKC